jgi:hypothetical protein
VQGGDLGQWIEGKGAAGGGSGPTDARLRSEGTVAALAAPSMGFCTSSPGSCPLSLLRFQDAGGLVLAGSAAWPRDNLLSGSVVADTLMLHSRCARRVQPCERPHLQRRSGRIAHPGAARASLPALTGSACPPASCFGFALALLLFVFRVRARFRSPASPPPRPATPRSGSGATAPPATAAPRPRCRPCARVCLRRTAPGTSG